MGKLIYLITTSLDGYVAGQNGNFDWAAPSAEIHAFVNDIVRNTGTFLFGRKMYETMKIWDDMTVADESENGLAKATDDFASIWRGANKIIYSTSLTDVTTANTTIQRSFDPNAIQKLVAKSDKDFGIGGPQLAAAAIKAGIVDDYHLLIVPVIIGSGTHWLPKDVSTTLKLVDSQQFTNGTVHLHYRKTP